MEVFVLLIESPLYLRSYFQRLVSEKVYSEISKFAFGFQPPIRLGGPKAYFRH